MGKWGSGEFEHLYQNIQQLLILYANIASRISFVRFDPYWVNYEPPYRIPAKGGLSDYLSSNI
jgi:hypothetical protein